MTILRCDRILPIAIAGLQGCEEFDVAELGDTLIHSKQGVRIIDLNIIEFTVVNTEVETSIFFGAKRTGAANLETEC